MGDSPLYTYDVRYTTRLVLAARMHGLGCTEEASTQDNLERSLLTGLLTAQVLPGTGLVAGAGVGSLKDAGSTYPVTLALAVGMTTTLPDKTTALLA